MTVERRLFGCEVRAEGRRLSGTVMRYGDVSPSHRERFEPGSLRMADSVHLDLFHDVERAVAWHPGGGLALENGSDALTMRADLPPIPAANRALDEIRAGRIGGLSVEFKASRETREGGLRVIQDALLSGIGIVRVPSYSDSGVEARRRGDPVPNPWIIAQWQARKAGLCDCQDCHVSFDPGAFREVLDDPDHEILAVAGDFGRALASRRKGSLALRESDDGGLEIALTRAAGDTPAGRDVADMARAVPLTVRPIADEAESVFEEKDGVRRYSKVALRAVLLKPTDRSAPLWEDVEIDGGGERARASAPRKRRLWL